MPQRLCNGARPTGQTGGFRDLPSTLELRRESAPSRWFLEGRFLMPSDPRPPEMLPVHDHVVEVPVLIPGTGDESGWDQGGAYHAPSHVELADLFDGYHHDPRCMGDCGPCGGAGGVPDTGPNGEMAMTCLYCGGSGRCQGCNLYVTEQARERVAS